MGIRRVSQEWLASGSNANSKVEIIQANSEQEGQAWQEFVDTHAECSHYHRWGWKRVIQNSFGWSTFYLMAVESGAVQGLLPLVWQKSRLFGSFLTSLPFLNGGGVVAETQEATLALVGEAVRLAQRLRAGHLELRQRHAHQLNLPTKTNKIAVVRPVQPDAEKMWESLHHKVRTDIRKAMKSGLAPEFGGENLLDEFYRVFARNMRDLGTPVYSQVFFQQMLRTFPADTYICAVRYEGKTIAASFLTGYRDTLEAGWSCSLYRYLPLKPNVFLYWKVLCFAGEHGYRLFDFGRSSIGSGTHRFKMQWTSQEVPLYWVYWLRQGKRLPVLNPENPRYRLAIWLWRKLPIVLTKMVGPRVVRCLP